MSGIAPKLRQLCGEFSVNAPFRKNILLVGALVNVNSGNVISGTHSLRNVAGILNRGNSAPPNVYVGVIKFR